MKNFLISLIVLILCSCTSNRDCITTIAYKVYYSNTPVTKTYTFDSTDKPRYFLNSDRGSNSLKVQESSNWFGNDLHYLERTSAPIEVISFTVKHK